MIFSGTPKVDRCTTCHLGIDKKGFESAPQPFTTHPNLELYLQGPHPVESVGCTVCHQGRGRATGFVSAVHTPAHHEQEKDWGKYSRTHEYERLALLGPAHDGQGQHGVAVPQVPPGCGGGAEGGPAERGRAPHGALRLLRLPQDQGLGGPAQAGPDLTKITTKTNEEWMFRWIKKPRAFRWTRMPQVWDVRIDETAEQKARNDAEATRSWPTSWRSRAATPSRRRPRATSSAGRKMFETVGCLGCHRVGEDKRGMSGLAGRRLPHHGPHLDGTGSKVSAGWLYAWVRNPKGYWHDTRMPNLRLTEKEAADITAYLMSLKNEGFAARPRPALDKRVRDDIVGEVPGAQYPVAEAERQARGDGRRGAHAVPRREDDRPLRLLRLPQ